MGNNFFFKNERKGKNKNKIQIFLFKFLSSNDLILLYSVESSESLAISNEFVHAFT